MIKQAVCLLIKNEQGNYLAVARRENHDEWGLPGGKVDPGEDHITAAVRELEEETSLKIQPDKIYPLFVGMCYGVYDQSHYMTTTFVATEYEGEPRQVDAGPVDWVARTKLELGIFGDYNIDMFRMADFFEDVEKGGSGDSLEPTVLQGILGFVLEETPPVAVLGAWSRGERGQARNWATGCHFEASDNDVEIPAAPECLKEWARENRVYLPAENGRKVPGGGSQTQPNTLD